jgi:hypothetical protein
MQNALPNVYMTNMCHISNEERLQILGLEALELRQLQYDLLSVHKILLSKLEIESKLFSFGHNAITRGHHYKLFLSYCNRDVRKYF